MCCVLTSAIIVPGDLLRLYIVRLMASIDGKRPDAFRSNRPRKKEPQDWRRHREFRFSASPRGAFIQRFLSRPHPYNLVCVFQGPDERARYQQLYQAEKTPFHLVFSISKRPSTHVRRSHQLLCQIISRGLFLEDLHRLIFSLDADSWSN